MKYEFIFGPVNSRRLGISLGIDLVPAKLCTLNCIYCESGVTTHMTLDRREYVSQKKILNELDHYLKNNATPDYITFSGNGEPTLNSRIGQIIETIKIKYPSIKISVITNGTLLHLDSVKTELQSADIVMPSLDAASIIEFQKINKPHFQLSLNNHIQGLIDFSHQYIGKLCLEILFLKGVNDSVTEIENIKVILDKISIHKIQLNTLDRPGVDECIEPVSLQFLEQVQKKWKDLPVEIIAKTDQNPTKNYTIKTSLNKNSNLQHQILQLISRRSCTLTDLEVAFNISQDQLKPIIHHLESQKLLTQKSQSRGTFYSTL